jgi:hypothetical protein
MHEINKRNALYPTLQDHELVKEYPPVRGIAKPVYFFTHEHKEGGGGDESASKQNEFEVSRLGGILAFFWFLI